MEKLKQHWTARSAADFVYRVASDFVAQLEKKIEKEGITQKQLADRIGISVGRVSQVLNDPGNLRLESTVQFARALGMKVSVVAYEDGDHENHNGPINSEIFYLCWKHVGGPKDFFELSRVVAPIKEFGCIDVAANTGSEVIPVQFDRCATTRAVGAGAGN